MSITYFQPRTTFDFSKDTLDIGNVITWNRFHFLKHLFNRMFLIRNDQIEAFYQRHLNYYLANHQDGSEEVFFKYLWELIERQLQVLRGKDVYDEHHIRNQKQIERLQKFTEFLIPLDRWNFHRLNDAVIAKQESQILAIKQEVDHLKAQLKKATVLETDDYINIRAGRSHTLYHLMLQLQELALPEGGELLYPANQIVWRRMICKFFREDGNEINFNSIQRYFPADKKNIGNKYAEIAPKHKLFKILPVKKHGQ